MAKCKTKPTPQPYEPINTNDGYLLWDTNLIQPNPRQPRKYFDREKIEALKKSIAKKGIYTPLRIVPLDIEGNAKLVDGERRFRAATELCLKTVPVILSQIQYNDEEGIFLESVIANFCREDMTEIETANALNHVMKSKGLTQAEVAELMGKTQSWVTNMLKYLKLHSEVAQKLSERKISPSMAISVSRYPQDKQPILIRSLEDAKAKKGRSLSMEEIHVEVSKQAAKEKVLPAKPKKGKMPETNPSRIQVNIISRKISDFTPALEELLKINVDDLQNVGGEPLLALESSVKELMPLLSQLVERLRQVL